MNYLWIGILGMCVFPAVAQQQDYANDTALPDDTIHTMC